MVRNQIVDPYFPTCPIRNILSRMGEKWTLLVLLVLNNNNSCRFNKLQKAIPDISQRMLTTTLRSLEGDGLIHREVYAEMPLRVEYSLTDRSRSLMLLIEPLVDWSINNYNGIISDRKAFDKNTSKSK